MKPFAFNLLPPDQRTRMHTALYVVIARQSVIMLFLAFLIVTAVLYVGDAWLHRSADEEEGTVAALVSRVRPGDATTLAADIAAFNDSLVPIDQLQATYTKWSVVLGQFLATLPAHNVLGSLTVDRDTTTITAVGVATTREDFQALQKAFTDSKAFSGTTLPTPDLLERDAIPFTLTTHFTP